MVVMIILELELSSCLFRIAVLVLLLAAPFSNLSYSKENCKVLEFCAKNREDHSFQLKYKLIKDYQYHLIDADDKFNAELDLKLIEDFLDKK